MSGIIQADAKKRANDLAEIQDGIAGENRWYWADKARNRLNALREDEPMFGLLPHERSECNALARILRNAGEPETVEPTPARLLERREG
jgi:hypothetical protein